MLNLSDKRILVTGSSGFLGRRVVAELLRRGVPEKNLFLPRSRDFDLRSRENCESVVAKQNIVLHLAGLVAGVQFTREHPADMFYENVSAGTQIIEAARQAGVSKFLTVGSVYVYPRDAPIPLREETIWDGFPAEEFAAYGIAKRVLLDQIQAYRKQYGFNGVYLVLTSMYGPWDNFDPAAGKVIPSLIRKAVEAKENGRSFFEVWGTGSATRDFLYVEDAASAIVSALERYDKSDPVNVGSGREVSIKEVAEEIARLTGFRGEIKWDASKPEGQKRFLCDISRAKKGFGFSPRTDLAMGLEKTIRWFLENRDKISGN